MIRMSVREQCEGNPSPTTGHGVQHPLQMLLIERSGIDNHTLRGTRLHQDPGVGALQRHRARIRREHAGRPRGDVATDPGGHHSPATGRYPKGRMQRNTTASSVWVSTGVIGAMETSAAKNSPAESAAATCSTHTTVGGSIMAEPLA